MLSPTAAHADVVIFLLVICDEIKIAAMPPSGPFFAPRSAIPCTEREHQRAKS
jgi:hypothetical protein